MTEAWRRYLGDIFQNSETMTTVMWTYLGEIGHLTLMRGLQRLHSLVFPKIIKKNEHVYEKPTLPKT
jgi:hypothetical protein